MKSTQRKVVSCSVRWRTDCFPNWKHNNLINPASISCFCTNLDSVGRFSHKRLQTQHYSWRRFVKSIVFPSQRGNVNIRTRATTQVVPRCEATGIWSRKTFREKHGKLSEWLVLKTMLSCREGEWFWIEQLYSSSSKIFTPFIFLCLYCSDSK